MFEDNYGEDPAGRKKIQVKTLRNKMREKILFLLLITFLIGCNNNSETKVILEANSVNPQRIDSIKWFYYAYSYNGLALFKKGQETYSFQPISCNVLIDTLIIRNNDSLEVRLSLHKEGYNYSHLSENLNYYGLLYINSAAIPLTGNVILDHFDDPSFVKKDNQITDSLFRKALETTDTSMLSSWLFNEAKKRGIYFHD
ncbi:MAG: hypothetical protein E6H07_12145 [Bacteroidetes bacterium]|nr:MAG: hypothetical protein E6H07_12145 [Bacteroidota bacterium]